MDWKEVWPNLVANLLALIPGIPIGLLVGLWVDRLITQRNTSEQTKAQLASVIEELNLNKKILANIASVLNDENNKGNKLPVPNVLLTAWSTAKQQGFIQAYKNQKQLSAIITIYRDLEEIETRVEQLWWLKASGMSSVADTGSQFRLLADRSSDLANKAVPKIDILFLTLGVLNSKT